MKRPIALLLILLLLLPCAAIAAETLTQAPTQAPAQVPEALIESAVTLYGKNGPAGYGEVEAVLETLTASDADKGARWGTILSCWRMLEEAGTAEALPEGLPGDASLCIVVLGYQLNEDGTMREELYRRLRVALACAAQYPNAYILCTGGHTASKAEKASEGKRMADWLIKHGVEKERVIAETRSLSTVQNALCTLDILTADYPFVTSLAVISSDYHVCAGAVLLEAASVLSAPTLAEAPFHVLACAACPLRGTPVRSYAVSGLKSLIKRAW